MKITILCVGKIKEKYWRDAIAEYSKRLQAYCRLEVVEVSDERTPDHASEAVEETIREKEGGRILKMCREDAYRIVLDLQGTPIDSVQLSDKIAQLGIHGESHIQFIIGGSLGLSKEILSQADERISFSKLTFPHQLMRVILLEQIYRSYRIMRNEPYHK